MNVEAEEMQSVKMDEVKAKLVTEAEAESITQTTRIWHPIMCDD